MKKENNFKKLDVKSLKSNGPITEWPIDPEN